MTTFLLSALAVLLAWPVPMLLIRLPVIRRAPRSAMVLWQAVALGAVLSALGAGLSLVTGSLLRERNPGWYAVAALALLLTTTVLVRLLLSGHRVGTRLRLLRRRHRELVDLLATDHAGVRVLEHEAPMAYCLPGLQRSRVVVSAGARRVLTEAQMAAVLAHERAHLRARHDLVLEAFTVLDNAFPRLVAGDAALSEVRLLVEVLADRTARRRVGVVPLVGALVALAGAAAPDAALGAGGARLVERIELIRETGSHRLLSAGLVTAAGAVLVLPTLFVALPWLASLPR